MDKLKKVIAETFQVPLEDIQEEGAREDLAPWDSVGHINLVMALEKNFEVTFTTNEILEMNNLSAIRSLLQQKGVAEL